MSSSVEGACEKAPGYICKENELSGFRARVGGAAFSQTELLIDDTVSLLIPNPTQPAGAGLLQV